MKILLLLVIYLLYLGAVSEAQTFTNCAQTVNPGLIICASNSQSFETRQAGSPGPLELVTFANKTSSAATIPINYFSGLTIKTLLFSNVNISTISSSAFTGAVAVKELAFCCPQLMSTSADAFTPIKSTLTKLSFINSAITMQRMNGIASGLATLDTLQTLVLSGNGLITLSAQWFNGLTDLKSFEAKNNQIESIQLGTFKGNSQLTKVDLSGNKISDLDALFTAMLSISNNLQTLVLSSNKIATVSNLPKMDALSTIDLSSNHINSLASISPFENAPALTNIQLSNNSLTSVPNIERIQYLVDLDLSNQNSHLIVLDNALLRNAAPEASVNINFDTSKNVTFSEKAFCSYLAPAKYRQITVPFSATGSINKCHFAQFQATAASRTDFRVSRQTGVVDYSSFCNCEIFAAAKAYNVILTGACDSLTDAQCSSTSFNDTCSSSDFFCNPPVIVVSSGSGQVRYDHSNAFFLILFIFFSFNTNQI